MARKATGAWSLPLLLLLALGMPALANEGGPRVKVLPVGTVQVSSADLPAMEPTKTAQPATSSQHGSQTAKGHASPDTGGRTANPLLPDMGVASVPAAQQAQATLSYFNRPVFVFKGSLFGVSAADRARRAHLRLQELMDLPGPLLVTQTAHPIGVMVQIDGATAFIVTPQDLDVLEQESLDVAAKLAVIALQQAIEETRESRDMGAMLRAVLAGVAATAVLLALVVMLSKAKGWAQARLQALTEKHVQRLQLAGVALLRPDRMWGAVQLLLTWGARLVSFVLLYTWASFVLALFPFTRAWGETLSGFLWDLLVQTGTGIAHAVPGLVTALLIFFIARALTKAADGVFERVASGQIRTSWLDADVEVPTRRIVRVVIWLFGLAMAYPYLPGADTDAFKGLSVLVGLMISLGASNLVGQAASGLILTYGRVFRKGEFVRIGEHEGTVTEVGMFATRIRTGLGEELTLSNSTILATTTKNYSRTVNGPGFVLDTTLTIGYDTPWRQVHAMLEEAALRTPGVLAVPAPQVFQIALSDWYPEYRLVCQAIPAEPRPRAEVMSALHANIQDVFNGYGVQIMSPQYFEDPPVPKVVPPEHWYAAPAKRP
ncbi:mechanosensitive ion channel family protein [Rhodoferax aquaticus]|nr:mechanosensitive ion channel family protein [Rhodoferax aquaticus]